MSDTDGAARAARAEPDAAGWGSSALRRATLTLAVSQLVSWGVLFYGFAVVAPSLADDTGWSEGAVSGAFSVGLLVAGFGAPAIASALARVDPRVVLTSGSVVGTVGMLAFAAAESLVVLYLAWVVIGAAMAAILYEPAMAVLVALDPPRRHRTIAAVTVAGGLASTVFAPLGGWLVEELGWREALVLLALAGGALTTVLHAVVLPPAGAHSPATRVEHEPAPPVTSSMRRLRSAVVFEQSAMIASTAYLISLLVDRGTSLSTAAAALGVMGVGKVAGRLLLLGPAGRGPATRLMTIVTVVQCIGLALPLAVTHVATLFPTMFVVGAASGAATVLRPLIVVDLVGAGPFAATNARLQRASTVARSAAPLLLGLAASAVGWPLSWAACLVVFALAAERFLALDRAVHGRRVGSLAA